MTIGIIAAMEEEVKELRRRLEDPQEIRLGQFRTYTGHLCGQDVAVLPCGIGKVNAAVGAALLIDKLKPDCVINTGVAGGFADDLEVGDIVISTEVRHHDADATVLNYEYGQIPRMPATFHADKTLMKLASQSLPEKCSIKIVQGAIMSGDSFIHHRSQIETIRERFPSIVAVEMEGAAIAQTCHLFGIPFVIIRSISDKVATPDSHQAYEKFVTVAAKNSAALTMNLLHRLQDWEFDNA